ncbi:hypothetical protein HaLaN_02449 [Haematococcus lacustris]|uniref:Uncharacterized protein n=1 Tax=Haematococcus lacustris TaxID=44745 RepID=A0A699YND0_HAELA|nr:hypothetical protein HaLaN_02449 [Haematococcus lacustris]
MTWNSLAKQNQRPAICPQSQGLSWCTPIQLCEPRKTQPLVRGPASAFGADEVWEHRHAAPHSLALSGARCKPSQTSLMLFMRAWLCALPSQHLPACSRQQLVPAVP